MGNIKRNENEYLDLLIDELNFLLLICKQYDNGQFEYAKKISLSLRILIYNAGKGKSLLSHIKKLKKISFYTPVKKVTSENKYTYYLGMVCPLDIKLNTNNIMPIFVPFFYSGDDVNFYSKLKFNDWWNEKIIIAEDESISRYEIIKYMANQDWGAHVDEYVNEKYKKIANNIYNFLSLQLDEKTIITRQYLHYAIVRQIAHEVILSIINEFKLNVEYNANLKILKNINSDHIWLTNLSLHRD